MQEFLLKTNLFNSFTDLVKTRNINQHNFEKKMSDIVSLVKPLADQLVMLQSQLSELEKQFQSTNSYQQVTNQLFEKSLKRVCNIPEIRVSKLQLNSCSPITDINNDALAFEFIDTTKLKSIKNVKTEILKNIKNVKTENINEIYIYTQENSINESTHSSETPEKNSKTRSKTRSATRSKKRSKRNVSDDSGLNFPVRSSNRKRRVKQEYFEDFRYDNFTEDSDTPYDAMVPLPDWLKIFSESQKQAKADQITENDPSFYDELDLAQNCRTVATRRNTIVTMSDLTRRNSVCSDEVRQFVIDQINVETLEKWNKDQRFQNAKLEVVQNKLCGGTVAVKPDHHVTAGELITEYPGKLINLKDLSIEGQNIFDSLFWMYLVDGANDGEVYISLKVDNAIGQLVGSSCLPCSNVRFVREGDDLFIRAVKNLSEKTLIWMSYSTGYWAKTNDREHAKCGVCGVSLVLND